MLALCSMLSPLYYAPDYAGIIGSSLAADESGNEAELVDRSEQSFKVTGEQSTSYSQSSTSFSQFNDTICRQSTISLLDRL